MGQSTQNYLKCCFLICFLVFKVLFSWKIQYSFAKYIQYFNLKLTQQIFVLMKTSWRRSLCSSSEDIFKTSSRRLDQDEYICFIPSSSSEDVFITFWSRWIHEDDTSSRRFKDILKEFTRRIQNVFKTYCKDVSSRHLKDVFKTNH